MSSLVRFRISNSELVCVHIHAIDVGIDLFSWLTGHSFGNIRHISVIYRIYIKHKYKDLVSSCDGTSKCTHKIKWNYDIYENNQQVFVQAREFDKHGIKRRQKFIVKDRKN